MAERSHRERTLFDGLRGFQHEWANACRALRNNRVVTAMPVASAGVTFFLDVGDLAACRDFAISADDTAARHRRITEEPNQTHDAFHDSTSFPLDTSAIRVPAESMLSLLTYRHDERRDSMVLGSGFKVRRSEVQ